MPGAKEVVTTRQGKARGRSWFPNSQGSESKVSRMWALVYHEVRVSLRKKKLSGWDAFLRSK